MSDVVNPLPPQPRGGCCGIGCLTLFGLVLLLALALVGGAFWGVHYVRKTYSGTEPLEMPSQETETPPIESATEDQPTITEDGGTPFPTPIPQTTGGDGDVNARWKAFEKAAHRHQKARIELSAADINTLIQNGRNIRGKAFVSIANNVGRVRVSVPLDQMFLMEGRYLNGEAAVEASPDGDPAKARISNVVLAGSSVPESVLDQRWFGMSSIRGLITQWLDEQEIASFQIVDDRVIGETRGGSR